MKWHRWLVVRFSPFDDDQEWWRVWDEIGRKKSRKNKNLSVLIFSKLGNSILVNFLYAVLINTKLCMLIIK